MSLRVLKLGGSLLDLPDLAGRFRHWLDRQDPLANVMVVGGGALADAIRTADRTHALGEIASHDLCLQAMGLTAALAERIFAGSQLRTNLRQIDRRPGAALQILDVRETLDQPGNQSGSGQAGADGGQALPQSWQVTSDSIAAHVAHRLGASELVLLKSALPSRRLAPQDVADSGFVDRHFPRALGRYPVRIVNLRDADFGECRLALPADDECRRPNLSDGFQFHHQL